MIDLWLILLPILVADVLNPVLLAATVYALGTARPYREATLVVLGHTVAYFGAGVALALGLEYLVSLLENPGPVEFGIELAAGFALLVIGVIMLRAEDEPSERDFERGRPFGPGAAFALGATINVIGLPFAVPYVAAIDQILKADIDTAGAVATLAAYNLLYGLPFAAVILLRALGGRDADRLLARINAWVDRIGGILLPIILIVLGNVLVADAAFYFSTGTPLLPT